MTGPSNIGIIHYGELGVIVPWFKFCIAILSAPFITEHIRTYSCLKSRKIYSIKLWLTHFFSIFPVYGE